MPMDVLLAISLMGLLVVVILYNCFYSKRQNTKSKGQEQPSLSSFRENVQPTIQRVTRRTHPEVKRQSSSITATAGDESRSTGQQYRSMVITRDQGRVDPTEQQHRERRVHNFDTFIQHVRELFEQQCRDSSEQFAVSFLASESDYTNMVFHTAAGRVDNPASATNNVFPIFPQKYNLCNYIVARNDGAVHAETLLVDNFDELMRNYKILIPTCKYIAL